MISVYLVHAVGPTPFHRSIVQRALSIAKAYGSPWIIAGDFNMSPSIMVHSWGPMLEQADAYVFAPSEPTHRPRSGAHKVFDYALCSSSAADWVKSVSVDLGLHSAPHRAVRISLQASPKNYLVSCLKNTQAIPRRPTDRVCQVPCSPRMA